MASFLLLLREQQDGLAPTCRFAWAQIVGDPVTTFKLGVPALLYTLQNNLLFFALSHLPAPVYQVGD